MFKYTLAATLDEMDREGITVAECPLRSMRCLSLQNGRIVGINTARFDSSAEVRTALIHEDGHFASGAFYLPYSPYQLKAQARPKAAYCLPWLISARRRIRVAISALSSSVR